MSLLPDEVKTTADYLEYWMVIHKRKPNKKLIKRQEVAINRLVKAFGYEKVTDFEMGFENCQFPDGAITFVIKARKK